MTNLVDLHCHILPGIDDGAADLTDLRALLEQSVRGGVDRFVFTPHFYPDRMDVEDFLQRRDAAFSALQSLETASGLRFRLGAEIAYVPFFDQLPLERLTFGDTRYLLLELDFRYLQPGVDDAIRACVRRGLTPIIAHVERYPYVEHDPTLLYSWIHAGALAQVNAGFVLRGGAERKRFLQYTEWGLVHVLASDTHHIERRPPNLAEGYAKIPDELADRVRANAQAVFENKRIELPKLIRPERRWGKWR